MLHVLGVYGNKCILITEQFAFVGQNIGSQFLGHVCLAVLVERHQFVYAEDLQFDKQIGLRCGSDHLRTYLVNIEMLSDHGILFIVFSAHVQGNGTLQKEIRQFALREEFSVIVRRVLQRELQFCVDLIRLIYLALVLDAMQSDNIILIIVFQFRCFQLPHLQFMKIFVWVYNVTEERKLVNKDINCL